MVESRQRQSSGAGAAQATLARGAFNEAFERDGQPRAHWKTLLSSLGGLGLKELAVRTENGRRLLREHGVGCGDPAISSSGERAWELDCFPLVFGAEEWTRLASGLVQRAQLLNAILNDLYSVQRLVRDGFVPAPLMYANPGYWRACQAIQP